MVKVSPLDNKPKTIEQCKESQEYIISKEKIMQLNSPLASDNTTYSLGKHQINCVEFAPSVFSYLRELDGVFGGELAGHYYFRDFYYSDSGLLASILILNVVAKMKAQGISLSQLISRIEKYQNSGEINFRVEDKLGAMNAVRDYFMNVEKPAAYMDFDGYRVEFPQWWFNIRPSNTEPYLRFLCEATSKELLDEKVAKVREILKEQFGEE